MNKYASKEGAQKVISEINAKFTVVDGNTFTVTKMCPICKEEHTLIICKDRDDIQISDVQEFVGKMLYIYCDKFHQFAIPRDYYNDFMVKLRDKVKDSNRRIGRQEIKAILTANGVHKYVFADYLEVSRGYIDNILDGSVNESVEINNKIKSTLYDNELMDRLSKMEPSEAGHSTKGHAGKDTESVHTHAYKKNGVWVGEITINGITITLEAKTFEGAKEVQAAMNVYAVDMQSITKAREAKVLKYVTDKDWNDALDRIDKAIII